MKKSYTIWLCLLLSLTMILSGCSGIPRSANASAMAPKASENVAESAPAVDEPIAAPADSIDYTQIYANTLRNYYCLAAQPDDTDAAGTTGAMEIARHKPRADALQSIGYTIQDLSGDGIPELLICSAEEEDSSPILAVFTCTDGSPACMLEGWSRNRYYLTDDGRILNIGSGGAMYTIFATYLPSLDCSELICQDYYFTYEKDDSMAEIGFYHNTSGLWDKSVSEELDISDTEFWQLLDDLNSRCIKPELTTLAEYAEPFEAHLRAEEIQTVPEQCIEYEADSTEFSTIVLLTPQKWINNVQFLSLQVNEVTPDGIWSYESEPLYAIKTLSPEQPLAVHMTFFGSIPNYGVSYIDEAGCTRVFAIALSGEDGSVLLQEI